MLDVFHLNQLDARSLSHRTQIRCMSDEHRDAIITLTEVFRHGSPKEKAFEPSCLLRQKIGGFKLGLEKRQENSESDPSHPVVASVRSAGGVCRVEWRGRKERENGLPRFPFPSLCLSLLKSDLPQMPRAFFAHKM